MFYYISFLDASEYISAINPTVSSSIPPSAVPVIIYGLTRRPRISAMATTRSPIQIHNSSQPCTEKPDLRNNMTNSRLEKHMSSGSTCSSLFSFSLFFLLLFFPDFEELGKGHPDRLIPTPRVGGGNFPFANSFADTPRVSNARDPPSSPACPYQNNLVPPPAPRSIIAMIRSLVRSSCGVKRDECSPP
ncbi:hypothetical protein BDM02DRAFT_876813 [Thelephora ganbajun]|uniref:Uncharacterized protein n=1 Tax=Thelephora ganbajun TaxID=370292 RepID=A0ACB6Z5B0_THEGA|nr:hypothetical protein BDM02DRAFT_876813 [Thelephora ganbajun]